MCRRGCNISALRLVKTAWYVDWPGSATEECLRSAESALEEVAEALCVALRRHARYGGAVLVDRLSEVLELFRRIIVCEYVYDAEEVDVLLVRGEDSALELLVESLVLLELAIGPQVVGIQRV